MTVLELLNALENGQCDYTDQVVILTVKNRVPQADRLAIADVIYNPGGQLGKPTMEIVIHQT